MSQMLLELAFGGILSGMVVLLLFLLKAKTVPDRLLACNSLTSFVIALVMLLSVFFRDSMFLDVGIIYVMVGFITTIGFMKFMKGSGLGRVD